MCQDPVMVEASWGVSTTPCSFGVRDDSTPVDSDDPLALAEVLAARAEGYEPAPEAPMWCFVPAIWPTGSRAWVRDRRVRHLLSDDRRGKVERLPWTAADYADYEDEMNSLLRRLGLPARPAGRIWLLRGPQPGRSAQDVLDDIAVLWREADRANDLGRGTLEFVEFTQQKLGEIFVLNSPNGGA